MYEQAVAVGGSAIADAEKASFTTTLVAKDLGRSHGRRASSAEVNMTSPIGDPLTARCPGQVMGDRFLMMRREIDWDLAQWLTSQKNIRSLREC